MRQAATTQPPRILVGFDATESGLDALALGRLLAESTGAELLIAHMYRFTVYSTPEKALKDAVEPQHKREAEARLAESTAALAGFKRWRQVTTGALQPARGLHELAESEDAKLVVVGSSHRHGLGLVVPGTTAEKLLHGFSVPVAVAPAGWAARGVTELRTVAAGFDGSVNSLHALHAASVLAHVRGRRLRVVAVFEPPNAANPMFAVTSHGYGEIVSDLRAALRRRLEDASAALPADIKVEPTLVDGAAIDVLARTSTAADVLAVGSRGYGPARSILLGSVVHELTTRSAAPLLVVPRGAQPAFDALDRTTFDHQAAPA
jgi:nucleotide-binding universal stress UspA family protein